MSCLWLAAPLGAAQDGAGQTTHHGTKRGDRWYSGSAGEVTHPVREKFREVESSVASADWRVCLFVGTNRLQVSVAGAGRDVLECFIRAMIPGVGEAVGAAERGGQPALGLANDGKALAITGRGQSLFDP
jgi:hypothetical protein